MTAASPGPAPVTPGRADAPADVLTSLPRQWEAEAAATNQGAAYASGLRDCARELGDVLAKMASQQDRLATQAERERDEARAERDRYAEALQRIVDAVAAGDAAAVDKLARNALGLTRVGRPGPFRQPQPPPPGRSFEDLLADPCEQFDPRSELLASIAEYAAAPQASASACPSPQPAPELAAAMAETRAERDRAVIDLASAMTERDVYRAEADEARAVVAEMCAHWERIGTTREEDELIPQWRQRAGLDGA